MNQRHLAGLLALLLSACGGGGGGGSPATADPFVSGTDVPRSATESPAAAFDFANGVAASVSETSEPLVLGDATLATSETEEPKPL
ncbi:MAG: hypothetical protein HY854_08995 [Burkholderiales bacterium]|nr:hypothetical protein [Burkholderiales bacterium]